MESGFPDDLLQLESGPGDLLLPIRTNVDTEAAESISNINCLLIALTPGYNLGGYCE